MDAHLTSPLERKHSHVHPFLNNNDVFANTSCYIYVNKDNIDWLRQVKPVFDYNLSYFIGEILA